MEESAITISDLTMAYDDFIVMNDLNFTVATGDIFFIIGGSGCGKSTLLKHMIGLKAPALGDIHYGTIPFWGSDPQERIELLRSFGILYQSGALWSSMTLAENVALPLQQHTDLSPGAIADQVDYKLALVGLAGFCDHYPAEISGGMRKRAGLARAIALDPRLLFFDEPSAGLDPVSSRHLDQLILELRDSLGATVIIVSHELPSIFAIASNCAFLDAESKTMLATGPPQELLAHNQDPRLQNFLRRGAKESPEELP
ncbi:MAG: ATP-binding cassette domain-containing protein [Thermodesulfobacteriota bacterium]